MSINRSIITGNITRDAELRAASSGVCVLTFTVAVDERRRDPRTGEWMSRPNFIGCVVFGQRAESLAPMLTKGLAVAVEGRLRYSSWDEEGTRRGRIDLVADEIVFLRGRTDSPEASLPSAEPEVYDEDIPF